MNHSIIFQESKQGLTSSSLGIRKKKQQVTVKLLL